MKRPHPYVYWKVYQDEYGKVPVGHEIHHIDGDPWNNDISNLIALSVYDHYVVHKKQGDYRAANLIKSRLDEKVDHRYSFPTHGDSQLRYLNIDESIIPRNPYGINEGHSKVEVVYELNDYIDENPPYVMDKLADVIEEYMNEVLDFTRGGNRDHKKNEREIMSMIFGINSDTYTYKEIASRFKISEGSIRQIKSRAIKKLQEYKNELLINLNKIEGYEQIN